MISKRTASIIGILPKPLVRWFAKYITDKYISKYANLTVINKEKLDNIKSPVIYICNHLSNSDGLILNRVLGAGSVWFLAGIKLTKNSFTKIGLDVVKTVPISPDSPDRSAISQIIKLLKSGDSVCVFPEGTRSRNGTMIQGKKGVLLIAKLSRVPIVPIGIEGTEKFLPINNTDMGSEKFNYADVKVTIGDSFYLPQMEKGQDKCSYEQNALYFVMRRIAELLSNKYQGIYKE